MPQEPVKPLDMTTEEAMDFLFPKEVVEELKHAAMEAEKKSNPNKKTDSDNRDSTYENHN